MVRLIPRIVDKFGTYQTVVYFRGKPLANLTKKNYKTDSNGVPVIVTLDDIVIYYENPKHVNQELKVLKVTTVDALKAEGVTV